MDMLKATLISMYTACGIKDIETKRICDAPQPLFVVAASRSARRRALGTGQGPLLQALLCSGCIPAVCEPQVLYGDVYYDSAVYVRHVEQVAPPGSLVIQLFGNQTKITPKSSMSEMLAACYYGRNITNHASHVCYLTDLKVGAVDDVSEADREELIQQGYSQTIAFVTKMAAKEGK